MFDVLTFLQTQQMLDLLSNCCLVVTIAMFSSGIPECLQMRKEKSTGNVAYLPYLMTCVNCVAWMSYGKLNGNMTLIMVNAVGATLQIIYLAVFLSVAKEKTPLVRKSVITFTSLWLINMSIRSSMSDKTAVEVFGTICCVITVLMFVSPLAELKTVTANKSTATLSFPLTVTSFLCGFFWTLYGFAMSDNYIIIPNILGLATSLVRFYLFQKYPSTSGKPVAKFASVL